MSVRWKVSAWKVVSASAFLLLSVGLYLAAPTQGATWDVYEGDCIQDAVDSAGYGDTVLVHLGEYHQSVEFGDEDDGITLQGDGAVLDGTGSADPECDKFVDAIILHGGVEDVTIEGFEIRDYAAGAGEGEGNGVVAWDVGVDASTDDITVRNNKMHDLHWNGVLVGSDGTAYGGEGLHEDWLIEGNTICETRSTTDSEPPSIPPTTWVMMLTPSAGSKAIPTIRKYDLSYRRRVLSGKRIVPPVLTEVVVGRV